MAPDPRWTLQLFGNEIDRWNTWIDRALGVLLTQAEKSFLKGLKERIKARRMPDDSTFISAPEISFMQSIAAKIQLGIPATVTIPTPVSLRALAPESRRLPEFPTRREEKIGRREVKVTPDAMKIIQASKDSARQQQKRAAEILERMKVRTRR